MSYRDSSIKDSVSVSGLSGPIAISLPSTSSSPEVSKLHSVLIRLEPEEGVSKVGYYSGVSVFGKTLS